MENFIAEPSILFGAYITNATFSNGYGTQSSTAQLTVVFPDDGPLNPDDFETNFPANGTCVGVKIGELRFAGILQRYTRRLDLSGYTWDIVLESPSKVLDGVQVIIDKFMGNSFPRGALFGNQINNVWNPFGYRESPNSAGGRAFGGSAVNSLGFPAPDLLDIMEFLSTGTSFWGSKINYGNTFYELDLGELKSRLANFDNIRVTGPTQSAMSIISEVCSLCLSDFIVQVRPKNGSIENGIIEDPVIYIKVIDRSIQPDPNTIKQIVKTMERDQKLISAEVGKELSDGVTQKLVIGGPATRYYEAYSFVQVWGKTKDLYPQYVDYIVTDDGVPYRLDATHPILEIRMAMHSFNSWMLFHCIRKYQERSSGAPFLNPVIRPFINQLLTDVNITDSSLARIYNGTLTPSDLIDSVIDTGNERHKTAQGDFFQEELQKLYGAVKAAGDEYYGKKYLVYLPTEAGGLQNNLKFTITDGQYTTAWDVVDSAWNERFPYKDISFYDGDGKMRAAAEWSFLPQVHDYSSLGDSYYVNADIIAAPANPEKDTYFTPDGRAYCIVDIPSVSIYDRYSTETNGLFWALHLMLGVPLDKLAITHKFGFEAVTKSYGIAPDRVSPRFIGVPQVSNRYNWGPWFNALSYNGKAEVIFDDSLTPETFGGLFLLNQVGQQYAQVINSDITGVESGYIEVAGYPENNVGDRFFTSGPYVTSLDVSMGTDGYKTTYRFNTWTPEFAKVNKNIIDRFTTINKNLFRFRQDRRSSQNRRAFKPKQYPDKYAGRFMLPNIQAHNGYSGGLDANGRPTVSSGNTVNALGGVGADPKNAHVASMEQILSPVEIAREKKNAERKPSFKRPITPTYTGKFSGGNAGPTSEDLDPQFKHTKSDFNITSHGDKPEDLNLRNETKNKPEEIKNIRTFGFRGPLMLSSWCYGLDGKPMPFDTSDVNKFADKASTDRANWKTGPVDLKWDEERKVFSGGPEILEGYLTTPVTAATKTSPTTFELEVYRNKDTDIETNGVREQGSQKWSSTGEKINCVNRSEVEADSGKYCIVIRINYEYRILYVDNC